MTPTVARLLERLTGLSYLASALCSSVVKRYEAAGFRVRYVFPVVEVNSADYHDAVEDGCATVEFSNDQGTFAIVFDG